MNQTIPLTLIALPMTAAPLIYLIGRWRLINGATRPRICWLAVLTLLAGWIPFFITLQRITIDGAQELQIGGIVLQFDGVSMLLTAVVLALGLLVTLFSAADIAGQRGEEKYYATLLMMISMIIGLGAARDLFNLWLWFEGMAIASYLLVSFYQEEKAALEAGVKYLVQSATGSVLVLMGIALVLGHTGQLDFQAMPAVDDSLIMLVAAALFIVGFGVKIALVPMHTWLPDAHSQAPGGISAMLSGVVIAAGLVALLRSFTAFTGQITTWGTVLLVFGSLNMLLGNLMALRQKQVKRLLAYSSLSHMGYMLIGLGIALFSGEAAGAQGSFFHLLTHGLMKGLAFLAAGALLYAITIAADAHHPLTNGDLAGTAQRYPLVALTFSLALLGLAGLPPLAGFMSKWQIFTAGFQTHNVLIGAVIIFAALNSVLSLAYYAPLVNAMYRRQPSTTVLNGRPLPFTMGLPLALLALAVLVVGIWPAVVQSLTQPAGTALMRAFGL